MTTDHTVSSGDCISSIAFKYGFFPDTLWNHELNADLKELRKNGNTLMEGDIVKVPDLTLKNEDKADTQRHRFKRKGVPEKLRLRLARNGHPRADMDYRLDIDGVIVRGRTDADGALEHYIPPDARRGYLLIDPDERYELSLGSLPPEDDASGLVSRLHNLGHLHAADPTPEELSEAISAFQRTTGLPQTGEADEQTQAKLLEAHPC